MRSESGTNKNNHINTQCNSDNLVRQGLLQIWNLCAVLLLVVPFATETMLSSILPLNFLTMLDP